MSDRTTYAEYQVDFGREKIMTDKVPTKEESTKKATWNCPELKVYDFASLTRNGTLNSHVDNPVKTS